MLTLVIAAASEDIKEELEQNILYDQYDSMDEVINAVREMTQDAGPVKAVFFCPLRGQRLRTALPSKVHCAAALAFSWQKNQIFFQ